ncbi:hypothetical protein Atc_1863 [Acidithiobacillus caldus SM-1]|uniref:Uncharacterized protein n=1 Tax=Acidithiobacillus caldus (strain SM-1) TaxID=990288 RepID=F9ZPW7_ACICS|nr:hypothetical protein Atc_1863 [Acidithiobacillus caldus SM-1]
MPVLKKPTTTSSYVDFWVALPIFALPICDQFWCNWSISVHCCTSLVRNIRERTRIFTDPSRGTRFA